MKQKVVIKGSMSNNINGLTVILDEEAPFEELVLEVAEKFKEASKFFKNSGMAILFEGRELTASQQDILLDTITENSDIRILYLVDEDAGKEKTYLGRIERERRREAEPQDEGMFYMGTLRSGQVAESRGSVVVVGDVNPGGKVVSGGNVVIVGALKGVACAGITGNTKAVVVALEMDPTQIRISNIIASNSGKVSPAYEGPMIAYMKEENIYIEPLGKEIVNNLGMGMTGSSEPPMAAQEREELE